MKKLVLGVASAAILASCGAPENTFELNINVGEGNGPVKVSLEDNQVLFDGELKNGKLSTYISDIPEQHVMIQIQDLGMPVVYFHEGSDVSVSYDSIAGFTVKAGVMNDSAEALKARGAIFNEVMVTLEGKYQMAMSTNDTSAQKEIYAEAMNLLSSQAKQTVAFSKRNDLLGAAIILSQQQGTDVTLDDYKAVLNQISEKYHECPDYLKLAAKVENMERSGVGATFTDFTQNTPEGTPISVLDIEGKLVLVDFWASWCKPCRAANPALLELYNNYHDKGFNIVGISLDDTQEKWVSGIQEDGLPWPQMSDLRGWQNEISMFYGIDFIPQNILIDDNGVIVGRNMDPNGLEAFLSNNL
jgi:thiol-disulfide isomerase/thioredoxin